jgi:hypothetical protein
MKHQTRPTPDAQRPTSSVRCTPVSIQRQFSLTGRVRRWVNGCHYVWCTRGFEEAADVTATPDAKQCTANVQCETLGRAGAPRYTVPPLSRHLTLASASGAALASVRCYRKQYFRLRFFGSQTYLYHSNSTSFTNVLTPPSVHHHVLVC